MSVWLIFFDDDVMAFSTREKAWEYLMADYKVHARDEEWLQELTESYNYCCEHDTDYFDNGSIQIYKVELDPNSSFDTSL